MCVCVWSGFLVILPVNLTGGESSSGNSTLNDFDWFSMSNIQTGSPRMWIHVIGMYVRAADPPQGKQARGVLARRAVG